MEKKKKLLCNDFLEMKKKKEKIAMITAYSCPQATIAQDAGVDVILVGDSLGMVELGYSDTVPVTLDDMLMHLKAVVRGASDTHVIIDMPFMSYNVSLEKAIENAGYLYQQGRADSVKLEGGCDFAKTINAIYKAGIPVCGHIGLTPQTASLLGGFKVQGKTLDAAKKLADDALAVEDAGAFMIVLEAVPSELADIITEKLTIPTIGIGAGIGCSGQVLVYNDMMGLYKRFTPKFVKVYADVYSLMYKAVAEYTSEVKSGNFPLPVHSFTLKKEIAEKINLEFLWQQK